MNLEELLPLAIIGISIGGAFIAGLPAGYKILVKLIRDAEEAFKDGKITPEEFELLCNDLLSLSTIVKQGLVWLLEIIKKYFSKGE